MCRIVTCLFGQAFVFAMFVRTAADLRYLMWAEAISSIGCCIGWALMPTAPDTPPSASQLLRAPPSRRRDCHFTDTPCLSLLKNLLKVQGGAIK